MSRPLLISSSTVFGTGYLDHAETEIERILEGRARLLFVPHALADWKGYAALFRRGLPPEELPVGSRLESLWTIPQM